jgi:hypothetical protein
MRPTPHDSSSPFLAWACALLILVPDGGVALAPGDFSFEWDNGRCNLEAQEAKITDILAAIQEQTGIPIDYDEEDTGTTTQSVKDGDLERVMRLLGENVVLTYVADATAPDGYRVTSVKLDPSADEATRAQVARSTAATRPNAPGRAVRPPRETTYSGVGGRIAYTRDRQAIRFTPIDPNAPIALSGISPEEDVIEIDGKPISSFRTLTEMSRAIRGEAGTTVNFTVRRPNGAVVRHQVRRQQVTYKQ